MFAAHLLARRHSVRRYTVVAVTAALALTAACSDNEPKNTVGGGFVADSGGIDYGDASGLGDGGGGADGGVDTGASDTAAPSCTTADECDDSNPCTDDDCAFGACKHVGTGCCQNDADCEDGLSCTADHCDLAASTCTYSAAGGFCLVAGVCYPAGPAPGEPCKACQPQVDATAFSAQSGGACNDGQVCTTSDVCQLDGSCKGLPKASCCKSDSDCPSADVCVATGCDVQTGECKQDQKTSCCTAGGCCDLVSHEFKPVGTPCGSEAVASEWGCDGSAIEKREAVAGCDGSADGCSSGGQFIAWGQWQPVETCANDWSCILASPQQKPTCKDVPKPECGKHSDCADSQACSDDWCDAGKCVHLPAKPQSPCGKDVLATEYGCSSTGKGGSIQKREAVAACDGLALSCTGDAKYWGGWKTVQSCNFSQVCTIDDPSKPGTCTDAPKCDPGSTCCTAGGQYAVKGTQCGDKAADAEYQCASDAKGGAIQIREGFPGCSGYSTYCSSGSSSLIWGDWKTWKTCGSTEKCEVWWQGSPGECVSAVQCTPETTCCTTEGEYAPAGTKCGTSVLDVEQKCSEMAKGGQILERKSYAACSGSSTSCFSFSGTFWTDWTVAGSCKADEICEVDAWSDEAKCVPPVKCNPGATCCTSEGDPAPQGTPCGMSALKSEYKCSGAEKGGAVLIRKALPGCTGGSSTSCSYSIDNAAWGDWLPYKTCSGTEVCEEGWSATSPGSCVSTIKCQPGSQCCTEAGGYAAKGTKCGNWAVDEEYKCSSADPGGEILVRKSYAGCMGDGTFCSSGQSYVVWDDWQTYLACGPAEICKDGWTDSFPGSCTSQ